MAIPAPPLPPLLSTPKADFPQRASDWIQWQYESWDDFNDAAAQVSSGAAAAVTAKIAAELAAAAAAQSVPSVTSVTSLTLGTGSKGPITTNVTVPFYKGQLVVVAYDTDPTKRMTGVVTAAAGTSLTINVPGSDYVDGSGTYATWRISLGVKPSTGVATAADTDYWAGTSNTAYMTPATLTAGKVFKNAGAGSTITLDLNAGENFYLGTNLTGAHTLANPSNNGVGKGGIIKSKQNAGGTASLAFGSHWKRQGGAPSLSASASAEDWILWETVEVGLILYSIIKAPS